MIKVKVKLKQEQQLPDGKWEVHKDGELHQVLSKWVSWVVDTDQWDTALNTVNEDEVEQIDLSYSDNHEL